MADPAYGFIRPAPGPVGRSESTSAEADIVRYVELKLEALGHPTHQVADSEFFAIARPLFRNYHQKDLMLGSLLCPADRRIQNFLEGYLKDVRPGGVAQLPANTFLLDRAGLARVMSLPLGADTFASRCLNSY